MKYLLSNEDLRFKHNPFSGVLDQEITQLLVLRFDISWLMRDIEEEKPVIVEFRGKKGRGKTSHLKYLSQHFSKYPLYDLKEYSNFEEILHERSDVIFIDSIHHLRFSQRLKLYKSGKLLVFTTHVSRRLEGIIARRKIRSVTFRGLDSELLKEIIIKRIRLAMVNSEQVEIRVQESALRKMIRKYGDNVRAIMNNLYDKFQNE